MAISVLAARMGEAYSDTGRFAMADTEKCAHPACECIVAKGGQWGKYCSETCKEKGAQTELHCDCRHAGCR